MNYEIPTNNFTIVDNNYRNLELTTQEKLLYITLCTYYNDKKGFAYPSYADLKKACSIGDNRTLKKCIDSLIGYGVVTKETIKGNGCKYYLSNLHLVENYTTCKNTPSGELHDVPSGELHYHLVENSTTTNTNTNTNTNTILHQDADVVENLWSIYPNKKGKATAVKKIPKLIDQYGYEKIESCIKRYAEEVKGRDKKYIKHGSTFFNGSYMDYLDENEDTGLEYYWIEDPNTGEQIRKRKCTRDLFFDQYTDRYYYLDKVEKIYVDDKV